MWEIRLWCWLFLIERPPCVFLQYHSVQCDVGQVRLDYSDDDVWMGDLLFQLEGNQEFRWWWNLMPLDWHCSGSFYFTYYQIDFSSISISKLHVMLWYLDIVPRDNVELWVLNIKQYMSDEIAYYQLVWFILWSGFYKNNLTESRLWPTLNVQFLISQTYSGVA